MGTPRDIDKPYEGIVTVQADVTTDFKVIRRVLFSANDAGWAKIKFVTLPDAAKVSSVMAEGKSAE
jgi:biopolymer transport protein ExbD